MKEITVSQVVGIQLVTAVEDLLLAMHFVSVVVRKLDPFINDV